MKTKRQALSQVRSNDREQLARLLVGGGGFEMLCRFAKHLHLTGSPTFSLSRLIRFPHGIPADAAVAEARTFRTASLR
jgi:hypothetical protein